MPTTCLNFEFCPQTTVYEAESEVVPEDVEANMDAIAISETCGSAAIHPIASVEGVADIVIIPKKPKWKKKRRPAPPKRFCMIM
jgi:hypothetical protein